MMKKFIIIVILLNLLGAMIIKRFEGLEIKNSKSKPKITNPKSPESNCKIEKNKNYDVCFKLNSCNLCLSALNHCGWCFETNRCLPRKGLLCACRENCPLKKWINEPKKCKSYKQIGKNGILNIENKLKSGKLTNIAKDSTHMVDAEITGAPNLNIKINKDKSGENSQNFAIHTPGIFQPDLAYHGFP